MKLIIVFAVITSLSSIAFSKDNDYEKNERAQNLREGKLERQTKRFEKRANENHLELSIVTGYPIKLRLSDNQHGIYNASSRSIDTRASFDAKIRVDRVLRGEFDKKYINSSIRAHRKEIAKSTLFVIFVYRNGDVIVRTKSTPVRQIACWLEDEVNVPDHLGYQLQTDGEEKKCIIMD